jgi:uncharacterized RmlC-like cupin family protein
MVACSTDVPEQTAVSPSEFQKQLQTQLILAKPGDVITIPAGVHSQPYRRLNFRSNYKHS